MKIILLILSVICLKAAAKEQGDSSFLVRTSGKLTMLAHGLGEDRLGGAKAGYLDTSVLLKVIDSTKDLYLVKLSKSHTAYIDKKEVRRDSSTPDKPVHLTGSWSVTGDDAFDYLSVSLDERLPYKSRMEINSSKLIVDVFGVQSNTNWINQLRSAKEIKDVYYNQEEDDVFRITIELKHNQHWGYSIYYKKNTLLVRVRRQPSLRLSKMMVAVDAGHGGSNTGAVGNSAKTFEKDYTLRFAVELEKILRGKGADVIMTRTTDTTFNNVDRVLMLQQRLPDFLISLHLNSSANTNVKGVSTYYKHIGFRTLSTSLLKSMLQLDLNEFGNVGSFNFTLNAPTDFPNALVEIAFLSNKDDEKKILNPRFQKAVAKKIFRGMKAWLRLVD